MSHPVVIVTDSQLSRQKQETAITGHFLWRSDHPKERVEQRVLAAEQTACNDYRYSYY